MFNGRLQPQRKVLAVCVLFIGVVSLGWAAGGGPTGQVPATSPPSTNKVKPQVPSQSPKVIPPPSPVPGVRQPARKAPAKAVGAQSLPSAHKVKAPTPSLPPKATPSETLAPTSGKPSKKAPTKAGGAELPPTTLSAAGGRRDPFKPPTELGPGEHVAAAAVSGALPLGTRGLVISDLRVEGIVRQETENTMIAVVTNYTKRAYFLRVNDAVYNGIVSKITPEAVYFKEKTLDASGRVATHEVQLKLGSAPGEGR